MAITVRTLLEEALYLSVSDREFSPVDPDGSQINVALNILIRILDQYRDQIPFNTEKILNGEAELLNINATAINALDYILGNVTYPMYPLTQEEFSRIARIINLRAIPTWFWHDKANNAIRVYPLAQNVNDIFIVGFRPLNIISKFDELVPTSITSFMQEFLIYETAFKMCNYYNIKFDSMKMQAKTDAWNMLLQNAQTKISVPRKPHIKRPVTIVPWLAYLSGNTPGG